MELARFRVAVTRYAPVIFQQYVPARVDLRITIIGEEIFASAIHSQQTEYEVDYRMSLESVTVEPYPLPSDLRRKLMRFMRRLGIVYRAVDMRVTPEGRNVFLEVNTSGQWLFMQEKTGQPITQAIADYLLARDELVAPSPTAKHVRSVATHSGNRRGPRPAA